MGPLLECLRIPRNPALAGSSRRVLPVVGCDAPARQIAVQGGCHRRLMTHLLGCLQQPVHASEKQVLLHHLDCQQLLALVVRVASVPLEV